MSIQNTARAEGETLLHWLQSREAGYSSGDIARAYGTTSERIRTATNRVRKAYAKSLKVTA